MMFYSVLHKLDNKVSLNDESIEIIMQKLIREIKMIDCYYLHNYKMKNTLHCRLRFLLISDVVIPIDKQH